MNILDIDTRWNHLLDIIEEWWLQVVVLPSGKYMYAVRNNTYSYINQEDVQSTVVSGVARFTVVW